MVAVPAAELLFIVQSFVLHSWGLIKNCCIRAVQEFTIYLMFVAATFSLVQKATQALNRHVAATAAISSLFSIPNRNHAVLTLYEHALQRWT